MEGTSGADNLSVGYGRIDYCKRNRKSLLYSLVRMGFLRQARAGLVTSDYILELVFIEFFVQWKGSSNKLPPASYQSSLRVYPGEIFSLPLFSKIRYYLQDYYSYNHDPRYFRYRYPIFYILVY